jgi:hypothetical protein
VTRRWLVALAFIAACDRPATATPPAAPAAALPAGQQCLLAMICDAWSGCALVENGKVVSADRLSPGEPVSIANGCTNGATCLAAKAVPKGATCPVYSIPPVIGPPRYSCAFDGSTCRQR